MAKYEWSEVFMSIEGEGPHAGSPTAYIRFARCNFACAGFNNAQKDVTPEGYAPLGFNPKQYNTLQEIPLITSGCDSQYAVNPEFSHMWFEGDETKLGEAVTAVLPHKQFINPKTGKDVILSLTGGEPTLRAKFIPTLMKSPAFVDCRHVLIETNCAVPLNHQFLRDINQWLHQDSRRTWTWSNSPKLSGSGEEWNKAIVPAIAVSQGLLYGTGQVNQYFKFVCSPSERDFAEVDKAMAAYYEAGISRDVDVYIMPMACQQEDQTGISSLVAAKCIDRGYIYCHRVHLDVFGNTAGT